jgi:hypothetical protein
MFDFWHVVFGSAALAWLAVLARGPGRLGLPHCATRAVGVNTIYVSKHAIRRYIERVKCVRSAKSDDNAALMSLRDRGYDVGAAEAEIIFLVSDAVKAGAYSVRCANFRFVIRGQTVVSTIPIGRVWSGGRR